MSGSFENVGWAKNDDICLYNIYMMEELHSIVSLGAGAMSKLNFSLTRLERDHNPKFPKEYISRADDVLQRKRAFLARLAQHVYDPRVFDPGQETEAVQEED